MKYLLLLVLVASACSDDQPTLTVAELQDPDTCKDCHPKHYQEWSASMHAYASDDPIFIAMNKRGQADTQNALGTFCVQCHAPMAVAQDATNGIDFNPEALPKSQRGVTCYFCHNTTGVGDPHNNSLAIAMDTTMRGGVKNAVGNTAHKTQYLPAMDGNNTTNDSSMCGSCHDIVTPGGVHLERTFAEWKTTIFASPEPNRRLPCGSACHMKPTDDVIADDPMANVTLRVGGRHEHLFASVDQAMTPWPDMALNKAAIDDILTPAIDIVGPKQQNGGVCLPPNGTITVRIDSISVGHNFPSGASQDRRVWLEVIAYDATNNVVFDNGIVPEGMDPSAASVGQKIMGEDRFWDRTYKDAAKTELAHFFWDVVAYDSVVIKPPVTVDPNDPAYDHSTTTIYQVGGVSSQIDRIEARVRMRPLPLAMLDELISGGQLDASFRAKVPTLELPGAQATWTRASAGPAAGGNCNPYQ